MDLFNSSIGDRVIETISNCEGVITHFDAGKLAARVTLSGESEGGWYDASDLRPVPTYAIEGRRVVIIKGLVEEFYSPNVDEALKYANTLVQEDDEHTPHTVMVVPEEFLNNALTVEYVGTRVTTHREALKRTQDD